MNSTVQIHLLNAEEARQKIPGLSGILLDVVEGGDSIGFMAPLAQEKADAFWLTVVHAVAGDERLLLVAELDGIPVGTVQVVLKLPENQPHRADISKMLVHRIARNQGIGEALLKTAEHAAFAAGKTLLVLDTASPAAERLYLRRKWIALGSIPGFALYPNGLPCATTVFYKTLSPENL